jgi:hypothetical protein
MTSMPPIIYTDALDGIPFRSQLERKVAHELDRLEVEWAYERAVVLEDGTSPRYLPDFTITDAAAELCLPQWVEVKPMDFLYDLRVHCGIDRAHGDRFTGEIPVRNVDSARLKSWQHELWKPKMLAEITGESVLAVGGVGGTAMLSITLTKNELVFSREHPFVNQAGVEKKRRHAEREERYRLQREEWARHHEAVERQRAQRALEQQAAEQEKIGQLMQLVRQRRGPTRRNGYADQCVNCSRVVAPDGGWLFHITLSEGFGRWVVVCPGCRGY